jgi:hypothetical protein
MAKQTFSVGQTLTAAQMTSLQQTAMLGGAASAKTASYTLVASDAGSAISMSNASATTITVNTALFAAGDTVQITNLGVGVCTITAGTATVNTASSLALAQYESGTLDFESTSAAIFVKGAGAAAASGGMTSLASGNLGSTSVTLSSISQSYNTLILEIRNMFLDADNGLRLRLNADSGANYQRTAIISNSATASNATALTGFNTPGNVPAATPGMNFSIAIDLYTNTTTPKLITYQATDSGSGPSNLMAVGRYASNSAITSITITTNAGTGTFNAAGSYVLWGVK